MKLFSGKSTSTWAALSQAKHGQSGISATSVQVKQIPALMNFMSQLEKMKSIKPNANELTKAIGVLDVCISQIKGIIQPPVIGVEQRESSVLEGPAFNRRP